MLSQRIIDAHLHLSPDISSSADAAAAALDNDLAACGIARGVVLHLLAQPWGAEEFAAAIAKCSRLRGFINIDPRAVDADRQLRAGVETLGFIGLKLHPRLQRFHLDDPTCARLVSLAGEMGIPVLIDAFPDGDWLMMGFDPVSFARLAVKCKDTRIIVAHFGGHRCIDFMMLAKRIPNIWFDLSYSLLYYRGSSVIDDLLYCCSSLKYQRIFFGSDYPDRSIKAALQMSQDIFVARNLEPSRLQALLWRNAVEFFGWTDI
jgi:predicted TIM-barrel fold metal-dependent hydrolase